MSDIISAPEWDKPLPRLETMPSEILAKIIAFTIPENFNLNISNITTENSQKTPLNAAGLPPPPRRVRRAARPVPPMGGALRRALEGEPGILNQILYHIVGDRQPHRTDYNLIRRAFLDLFNYSIGPGWQHLTIQTMPVGGDPYFERMLQVRCSNRRSPIAVRRRLPWEPRAIEYVDTNQGPWVTRNMRRLCRNTNANVDVREPVETRLQFFRCQGTGHRGNNPPHGPNIWICSECADWENFHWDFFRWRHDSMFMPCYDCTMNGVVPRPKKKCRCRNHGKLTIRRVSRRNRAFTVRDWLCGECKTAEYEIPYKAVGRTAQRRNIPDQFGIAGLHNSPGAYIHDFPDCSTNPFNIGTSVTWRSHCQLPCTNTTRDTWIQRTDAEREQIIRICLVCEGEVPANKIYQQGWTNQSNTQIWPRQGQMGYPPTGG
ncbi:uncharacterized protein AB675_995 [Cyphellophora attinorum]|uniref:Uncharacterized protein n=1 Tax=Cyphellophora attinorum TaxID=1664694 RepID=A0A0N1H6Q7_9EURO|nr:uncharacterized protein AB675_995 [Phialophora attinorum]KPI38034.1 hypothetical protein AB675_995 [Phialophora attinorum]